MHRGDGCRDSNKLVGMEILEFQLVLLKLHCVPVIWHWGMRGTLPWVHQRVNGSTEANHC